MSLLEALIRGTTRPPNSCFLPQACFPVTQQLEKLPGLTFICTEMTKGHKSKLRGSAGGTRGGHVSSQDMEMERIPTSAPREIEVKFSSSRLLVWSFPAAGRSQGRAMAGGPTHQPLEVLPAI